MTTKTPVLELEETLDRLAAFEPGDFPVLSLYLDARANAQGRDDFGIFLKKEVADVARSYGPHTPEREGFEADVEKIRSYLETELLPRSNGVAVFACGAQGLFEAVQVEVAFDDHRLFVSHIPHLYPLAHILDRYRRYAAVVADTNSARIYVFGLGQPLGTQAVTNPKVRRHKEGGWSQMHYQRRADNVHLLHAKEVAEVLTRVMRTERLSQVVLAGDEVIVPLLKEHLPKEVEGAVIEVLSLDVRTPEHEVLAATLAAFQRHDEKSDVETVRRLLDAFRGGGLGAVGFTDVRAALLAGQVDELILSSAPGAVHAERGSPADPDVVDALVSQARQTSARVTFIEDGALLRDVGGVGALLRYRIAPDRAVAPMP